MLRGLLSLLAILCVFAGYAQNTASWRLIVINGSASSMNGYSPSSDIVLKSESHSASLPGSSLNAFNTNKGTLRGAEFYFGPSNIPLGFELEHESKGYLLGFYSLHLKMETRPDQPGMRYSLNWGRNEEVLYGGWKKYLNKTVSFSLLGGPSILFTKPEIEVEGVKKENAQTELIYGSSDRLRFGGVGIGGMARIEAAHKWLGIGLHTGFSAARLSTYASLQDGGPSIGRFVHYTFTPYWGFMLYLKSNWRL